MSSSGVSQHELVLRPSPDIVMGAGESEVRENGHFATEDTTSPFVIHVQLLCMEALRRHGRARWPADAFPPGGRDHWKPTRLRWKAPGLRSRLSANWFRSPSMGIAFGVGPAFPCFSG